MPLAIPYPAAFLAVNFCLPRVYLIYPVGSLPRKSRGGVWLKEASAHNLGARLFRITTGRPSGLLQACERLQMQKSDRIYQPKSAPHQPSPMLEGDRFFVPVSATTRALHQQHSPISCQGGHNHMRCARW